MKRRELEGRLKSLGWRFLRHGGSHDIWTDGQNETSIPRHNEIKEGTARGILKYALTCRGPSGREG
ncbi:MAG: type II toxin-antitoxin system HicA family toxin [Deltaproteobacteria bacterium]|nr:type II toxin-antitoxin system HicA family toxin [Deltaproteobacteria bacterium]